MDKKIKQFIENYKLLSEKAVILAVSGGPDSIVLLDLFVRHFPKEKIVIAHANHGLRVEARWDESFVKAISDEYQITFVSEKLKLKNASEAAAREARYEFLNKNALELGAKYILTAHHLNDQAETVLLSLVRGSGPLALWGMKEQEGNILRPLLSVTKKEIQSYARKNHLRYHLDRSNFDTRYRRNRIRSKVIPILTKINPNFLNTLSRNAELGQEMSAAWAVIVAEKQKKIAKNNTLNIAKLKKEPIFVQRELAKRMLESQINKKDGFSSENIKKIMDLLELPRGKKTEIGSLEIVRGTKNLTFGAKSKTKIQKMEPLLVDSPVVFDGFILKLARDSGKATKNNILLPESIGYNLKIRTWRDGDRIKTKAGTKKLQDVFSDAKIMAPERKKWPIVVSGRKILWVPKLAACEEALSDSKKKVIKIEVRNERKK